MPFCFTEQRRNHSDICQCRYVGSPTEPQGQYCSPSRRAITRVFQWSVSGCLLYCWKSWSDQYQLSDQSWRSWDRCPSNFRVSCCARHVVFFTNWSELRVCWFGLCTARAYKCSLAYHFLSCIQSPSSKSPAAAPTSLPTQLVTTMLAQPATNSPTTAQPSKGATSVSKSAYLRATEWFYADPLLFWYRLLQKDPRLLHPTTRSANLQQRSVVLLLLLKFWWCLYLTQYCVLPLRIRVFHPQRSDCHFFRTLYRWQWWPDSFFCTLSPPPPPRSYRGRPFLLKKSVFSFVKLLLSPGAIHI